MTKVKERILTKNGLNPSAINLNFLPTEVFVANKQKMAKSSLQSQIGKQIVIYNGLLIVITIIFGILRGFDREEFTALMALLGPITAVYVGTLFRYLGNSLSDEQANGAITNREQRIGMTSYGTLLRLIIPLHFIIILGLISAKALFNAISFDDMTLIFAFVETTFGGYVGYIISSLFGVKS